MNYSKVAKIYIHSRGKKLTREYLAFNLQFIDAELSEEVRYSKANYFKLKSSILKRIN